MHPKMNDVEDGCLATDEGIIKLFSHRTQESVHRQEFGVGISFISNYGYESSGDRNCRNRNNRKKIYKRNVTNQTLHQ